MLGISPFEVSDFSGGINDFIYDPNEKRSAILDNLVINKENKLETRPGSSFDITAAIDTNSQIPYGAKRIGNLINYREEKILVRSGPKMYYRPGPNSPYSTIYGPDFTALSGTDAVNGATLQSEGNHSFWNDHVYITHDEDASFNFGRPMKIFQDDGGAIKSINAGIPKPVPITPITATGAAGAANYIYAFTYSYTYKVRNQTFRVESTPIFVEALNKSLPIALANIPVGVADKNLDYASTSFVTNVYRTIDNGSIFYLVSSGHNLTSIAVENMTDATLQDQVQLYTNDGSVDNDYPPLCKFVHVVNSIGYYGYLQDGTEKLPYTLRQSVPGTPDAVPLDFEFDAEDELKGISSCQSIPIILCKKHIYRIEGGWDQFGRGTPRLIRISDHAGCLSVNSCVQAEGKLFWAGNDGFYSTDGYSVVKVSDGFNDFYYQFSIVALDKRRIQGTFDEINRRVYWTWQDDTAKSDNNRMYVMELRYGVMPESVFSTWSFGSNTASAITYFGKWLHRADHRGYVYKHDGVAYLSDLKLESNTTPSTWYKETIIWTYRSVALNMGSQYQRKWIPKILLTCKNRTNISIQINAINDDGKSTRPLKAIRWRRNFIWGDEDFVWGNPDCVWNAEGLIEQKRWMPAKGLRLSFIQVEVTNAYVVVENSDLNGEADFNNTLNTATLVSMTNTWPTQALDYYLYTSVDNYVTGFKVIGRSDSTLVLEDTNNVFPTGRYKWVLKGYPKGEFLNLLSYTLHVASTTDNQLTYEAGQDANNA
jgi:hypothetical protein